MFRLIRRTANAARIDLCSALAQAGCTLTGVSDPPWLPTSARRRVLSRGVLHASGQYPAYCTTPLRNLASAVSMYAR